MGRRELESKQWRIGQEREQRRRSLNIVQGLGHGVATVLRINLVRHPLDESLRHTKDTAELNEQDNLGFSLAQDSRTEIPLDTPAATPQRGAEDSSDISRPTLSPCQIISLDGLVAASFIPGCASLSVTLPSRCLYHYGR
jgi:hypothetical protein